MNSDARLPLNIDSSFPLPIHVQLREQLKCLIGFGTLRAGDFLPPANDLAGQLNLNRNTVILVYNQLSKEGYVHVRKGTGTQVAASPRALEDRAMLSRIKARLQDVCLEAEEMKEVPAKLLTFLQIYPHVKDYAKQAKQVLFVEHRQDDYQLYKNEIESIDKAGVSLTSLRRLSDLADAELTELLKPFDLIVVPYAGLNEVSKLAAMSDKQIVAVGDIPY